MGYKLLGSNPLNKALEELAKNLPAYKDYDWDREKKDLVEVEKPIPVFVTDSKYLAISLEEGVYVADYYGELHGGYPWISKPLIDWAEKNGGYWEWENPGAIVFVHD